MGALLAMLCLAGCPGGRLPAQLADTLGIDESLDALKDEVVLRSLREPVRFDPGTQATHTDDEPVNFAENAELYAQVRLEDVELPEEQILAETTIRGAPPFKLGALFGRFWNDIPGGTSDKSGGIFRGKWVAADGRPLGVVRGEYHPARAGELPAGLVGGGVLHGKYIDAAGHFRGMLRGRYGHAPDGRGHFFGHWHDRHDRLVGILMGHWQDELGTDGGRFAGRWAAFRLCDEVETLPDLEFEPDDFGGLEATDEAVDPQPSDLDETPLEHEPDFVDGDHPPCIDPTEPHGFLRGWHVWRDEGDESAEGAGYFHGRWRGRHGDVIGLVIGHYEPLPPADETTDPPLVAQIRGKFYGKYVDLSGRFRGFVRGVYGQSAHGIGVFRGRYFDADMDPQGVLLGRWDEAPQRPGGPFLGIWFGADLIAEP